MGRGCPVVRYCQLIAEDHQPTMTPVARVLTTICCSPRLTFHHNAHLLTAVSRRGFLLSSQIMGLHLGGLHLERM